MSPVITPLFEWYFTPRNLESGALYYLSRSTREITAELHKPRCKGKTFAITGVDRELYAMQINPLLHIKNNRNNFSFQHSE